MKPAKKSQDFLADFFINFWMKFFPRQLDRWKIRSALPSVLVLFTSGILPSHVHNKSLGIYLIPLFLLHVLTFLLFLSSK